MNRKSINQCQNQKKKYSYFFMSLTSFYETADNGLGFV